MTKRQDDNKVILDIISHYVENYPDLRFGQILVDTKAIKLVDTPAGIIVEDPFNEEPEVTLNRMLFNNGD